jgi:hypothetical protein
MASKKLAKPDVIEEHSDVESSEESEYSTETEDSEEEDPKAELKSEKNKKIQKKRNLFGFFSLGTLLSLSTRQKLFFVVRSSLQWLFRGLKFGGGIVWIVFTAYLFLVIPLQRAIASEHLFEEEKKLFEGEQQQLKNLGFHA